MNAARRFGQKLASSPFLYKYAPSVASAFDAVKTVGDSAGNAANAVGNTFSLAKALPDIYRAHYYANTPPQPDPYPALHATQPEIARALGPAAFGGSYDQGVSSPMPHHRGHRRHHG